MKLDKLYDHKPSWKYAPPWAEWLAADRNMMWWWYEKEPMEVQSLLVWTNPYLNGGEPGNAEVASVSPEWSEHGDERWSFTLERRPEEYRSA